MTNDTRIPSTPEARAIAKERGVIVPPTSWDLAISDDPAAKVQATWTDAKGRRQYGYHPSAVAARAEHKFAVLPTFEAALPAIRAQVAADIAGPVSRRSICALIVRIIDVTAMRVGSEEYALENGTYGASSLRKGHVRVEGDRIVFSFRGKSGKRHEIEMVDADAALLLSELLALPGERVMQDVTESAVNSYLKPFGASAKMYRTHHASAMAADLAAKVESPSKRAMNEIVKAVAAYLGNTPAVCKSSYINPAVFAAIAA